jgi:colanic acid/amylovoran biosynthesis glycosyltransferase
MTAVRIGYLASRYPLVSQTFVQREVEALRSLGLEIETFAVHRARPDEVLSAADRHSFATTIALVPTAAGRLLRAHLRALASGPAAYAQIMASALAAGHGSPRTTLWRLFYFAEAVLLREACLERRVRHIHVHFANPAADVAMLAVALGDRLDGEGVWGWSMTVHGPSDFFDVRANHLAAKAASACFVACISDFARSQVMAHVGPEHWSKLHVVRCGVDPNAFRPAEVVE